MSVPLTRPVSVEAAVALGLTPTEYDKIREIQGRDPTYTELAIYSLMWSEHCGYKHSRPMLKRFPTTSERVLQGPGENAGIVDVGDGWAVAMKVESHNHPSAVEPFQGAATGVGGIIRDIFTMGARPIASLDSLRFGELDGDENARQRYLFEHVVAGIGFYGNCIGIPTVAGDVYFEAPYAGNCLVNAMCAGLMRHDQILRAVAAGIGNHVVLIGSKTGRDGIGGASVLASQEFDETLEEKRPSVQVGDPFTEKKLIEACLELQDRKLVVSMQDLGAAGLTSSSSEMASKGRVGLDIHADRVPLREADMEPWEIMISESQERMLAIVEPAALDDAREVCTRWDLDATVIGEVTDSGMLRVLFGGEQVAEIPARRLADESPVERTPSFRPDHLSDEPVVVADGGDESDSANPEAGDSTAAHGAHPRPAAHGAYPRPAAHGAYPRPADLGAALRELLAAPNVADKRWAYEQYDYIVQANTVQIPGSDAAVLRIKGGTRGIAFTSDGNGRRCYLDPYRGAREAVAEAARNLSCVGALPVAVTDCLNFGNPEKGDIYWTFEQTIEGMSEACETLGTPVVSGNVSFYNESFGQAIYPTPLVGMLGVIDDVTKQADHSFKDEGDLVVLLGPLPGAEASAGHRVAIDGSEYQKTVFGRVEGRIPDVDLALEARVQQVAREGIRVSVVKSAHDCSDGGLAVTLAECAIGSGATGGARFSDPEAARFGDPTGDRRFAEPATAARPAEGPGAAGARFLGAEITLETTMRDDLALFGEGSSRIVVSVAPDDLDNLCSLAGDVPLAVLGAVSGEALRVTVNGAEVLHTPVAELFRAYESLPERLA